MLGQKAWLEPEEALIDFKPLKTGDRNQNSIDFQCAYKACQNQTKPEIHFVPGLLSI